MYFKDLRRAMRYAEKHYKKYTLWFCEKMKMYYIVVGTK